MILALWLFSVPTGTEEQVRATFADCPPLFQAVPGFLGFEFFQHKTTFSLLTRWSSEAAFQQWHTAQAPNLLRSLLPPGVEPDPSQTQLLVTERLDPAGTGGAEGALTRDFSELFAGLLREGTNLYVAIVDGTGHMTYANPAFHRVLRDEHRGCAFDTLLTETGRTALHAQLAGKSAAPFALQLPGTQGEHLVLRSFLTRLPEGFAIVAEAFLEEQEQLAQQLHTLNAELAVLVRENERQAQLLAKANKELQDAHWHLKKLSETLPICMLCHSVKISEDTWIQPGEFLARHSTFLSHGYCVHCAEKLNAEADREEPA